MPKYLVKVVIDLNETTKKNKQTYRETVDCRTVEQAKNIAAFRHFKLMTKKQKEKATIDCYVFRIKEEVAVITANQRRRMGIQKYNDPRLVGYDASKGMGIL